MAMITLNVTAAPQKRKSEHPTGCKWVQSSGRCTVFNPSEYDLVCRATAKTTISKAVVRSGWNQTIEQKKVITLNILVPAQTNTDFIRIKTQDGEIIEKMEIHARCKRS